MALSPTSFGAGLVLLLIPTSAAGLCAWVVVRRRLPSLAGTERVLAIFLVFTAAYIALHLVPTVLGVLSRGTVVGLATLAAVGTRWISPATAPASQPNSIEVPSDGLDGRFSWALVALAVTALTVWVSADVVQWSARSLSGVDALNFHVPDVVRWIQRGSLWGSIPQFQPDLANGNYPNNGNVVLLGVILPWHDPFLARFVFVPFFAATGVAVYALARQLGAARAPSVLASCVLLALPNGIYDLVVSTLPDAVMFSTFTAGLVFLVRHARTSERADLVLAGLGLGLALGTKWFGLSSAIAVGLVWLVARIARRDGFSVVWRDVATLSSVALLAGGVWLVRNLVLSGNPLFPQKIAPLGVTLFDAPVDAARERAGFPLAHYLLDGNVWTTYFIPAFTRTLGFTGYAIALTTLAAGALALRRLRSDRRAAVVLIACVLGVLLAGVYSITPFTAFGLEGRPVFTFVNVRYAVPGIVVAVAVAAWLATNAGRLRVVGEIIAVVLTIDGVRRALTPSAGEVARALIVLVSLAVAGFLGVRLLRTGRRVQAGAVIAVTVLAASAGCLRWQHRAAGEGYGSGDRALAWLQSHVDDGGHDIALAGTWNTEGPAPVLAAFGPRFRNEVRFAGRFVDGMLRSHRTEREFTADLERNSYDVLVVGRGVGGKRPPREQLWATHAGWRTVSSSARLVVMQRS